MVELVAQEQMKADQPHNPAIFIVAHNAEAYRELLVRELGDRVPVDIACTAQQARSRYREQPVVLGRPDFLVELLATRPPVAWVQSTWAGITPLARLGFQDYLLTGVKGVFGPQIAEYVFAYLLAHEIRLEQRWQEQQQRRWDGSPSGTLRGKVMGVMGTGSIGCHLATVARQFGMEPIGFNRSGTALDLFSQIYSTASIDSFLERCDYLVGVLPDTPATGKLLNEAAFSRMKQSAYLVNVGRGNLIDEAALCRALESKSIAGAVLDVFHHEPLPAGSPLWCVPGLRITGHVAAASRPEDISRLFLDNYRRFCRGEVLRHQVEFARGY